MKILFKIFLICLILTMPLLLQAQKKGMYKSKGLNYKRFQFSNRFKFTEVLSVYGSAGLTNYYGDLCDNFKCLHPRPSIGVGVMYRLNDRLYSKSEINYIRLASNDVWPDRNLSFRSSNFEIYSGMAFDYFEFTKNLKKRPKVMPYGFIGVGLLFYNPRGELNDKWYSLRPLQTEGKRYGIVTPIIPYGLGVKIKKTRDLDFMLEASYRMTFTDYLDDVSSPRFIKQADFSDPLAASLSNKTKDGDNFLGYRGNPKKNDGYFVFSFKVRMTFIQKHYFKSKYAPTYRKIY